MGAIFLNGVQLPDPISATTRVFPEGMLEAIEADRAALKARGAAELARGGEEARASGAESIALVVRMRADRYRANRNLLQSHFPAEDFLFASPKALLARVESLLLQYEERSLPRWYGHGGEVTHVNLLGAKLYAEWALAEERAA